VPAARPSLQETFVDSRLYEALASFAGMGSLTVKTFRGIFSRPVNWLPDAIEEAAAGVRRCFIPLLISHGVYLIGFGVILFGRILTNIGVIEREAGAMYLIWAREISTWITAMIFAGVVGAAVTADIGARRIREELDALSVLGVDAVRALVVPRVVATALMAPILAAISLLMVLTINLIVAPMHLGYPTGVYFDNVARTIYPPDLFFTMFLKNFLIGILVGIVACHKGLTCKRGSEGVGRAVNQAVVISFFSIWLLNSFFNLAYVSAFPQVSTLRG